MKKLKILIIFTLLLQAFTQGSWFAIPPAFAQGYTELKDVNKCYDFNSNLSAIVTVTEESLGATTAADQNENGKIFNCARATKCYFKTEIAATKVEGGPKGKWNCGPVYKDPGNCQVEPIPLNPGNTPEYVKSCDFVQIYASNSGTDLLFLYIGQIYRFFAAFGGVLSGFFLIIGGIIYASSGGNPDSASKGKAMIIRSLSGLALLFLSALLLYTVNPNFFYFS